jgi:presenilin-like A22 family membrane protease
MFDIDIFRPLASINITYIHVILHCIKICFSLLVLKLDRILVISYFTKCACMYALMYVYQRSGHCLD